MTVLSFYLETRAVLMLAALVVVGFGTCIGIDAVARRGK